MIAAHGRMLLLLLLLPLLPLPSTAPLSPCTSSVDCAYASRSDDADSCATSIDVDARRQRLAMLEQPLVQNGRSLSLKSDDNAVGGVGPFHTIMSARLPCLQNSKYRPPSPNACPNATTTANLRKQDHGAARPTCPCYASSNAFGSVEVMWNTTHGLPAACNVSNYPVVGAIECLTGPAQVAAALKPLPRGQRSIQWLSMGTPRAVDGKWEIYGELALWDLDSSGNISPWADEWQRIVSNRLDTWFGAFKSAGGEIDVVYYDLEVAFAFGHFFAKGRNNSKTFGPWVSDPRWPQLLAELNEEGSIYGVSFTDMAAAADTACCGSETCMPGCDVSDYHLPVWNRVMMNRLAKTINETLYRPVAKHFPGVEISNCEDPHVLACPLVCNTHCFHRWTFSCCVLHTDEQMHYSSESRYWFGTLNSGNAPPIGTGWHVGTHSSSAFYNGDSAEHTIKITLPTLTINRTATPFGMLLYHTRKIRSMARQFSKVMPWIDPREANFSKSGKSLLSGSDLYQETLFHMAMAGVQRFLWYRSSYDFPLTVGIEQANCVMQEADVMIGDAERAPTTLDSAVDMLDDFVLSGVRLGNGTVVYRFTPSHEQPLPKFKILSENPATFLVTGHVVVPVQNGRLLPAPPGSCAPGGYWIV